MRLIDADNLIIEILTHDLIGDDKKVDKMILDAPTVEAIPVEWIKKYIVDNTKIIDDLKYEVGANPVNYYIYPQQITKMLTAWWEKENESNS